MVNLRSKFQTALVTGASSGLGRSLAESLLADGVRVWGTSRRAASIAPFERSGFEPVELELGNVGGARAAVERAEVAAGGCFDLAVFCAGQGLFAPFADCSWADWERQLSASVLGGAGVLHAVARGMRSRGRGVIVVATAPAGDFQVGERMASRALSAMVEGLREELSPHGVRLIELRCGWMRTDYLRHMPAARLATTGDDDQGRMVDAWNALRAHVEQAPSPGRVVRRLRKALANDRAAGVVIAGGPSMWRRTGGRLLVWLGARPRRGKPEHHDA